MRKSEALKIIGGLGGESKMPGKCTSTPAELCKTGSKLRNVPGSTCSDCYALKGRYVFPVVRAALQRRFDALSHPQWVEAFIRALQGEKWFRWHTSGDIQSVEHLRRIVAVCEGTPDTMHWLPTREYAYVAEYRKQFGEFPANLCVRLSAHMIDGKAPDVGLPTSTVHDALAPTGKACPAPQQGGECADCRACWDRNVGNVSYKQH